MHILIAPNAFKNSLDAESAAIAIRDGLMQSRLQCTCECFPIGDGGDGTGDLIISNRKGITITDTVKDPLGRPVSSSFGLIEDGKTAIIEMANASGLRLLQLNELNPLIAKSYGTGEQIKIALDKGATKIIVGMGGSATVDGGIGILTALGIRFLDAADDELSDLPGTLTQLASVDTSQIDPRIANTEVVVLCDVDNFLLGDKGSAAVFGPQKGASPEGVIQLDTALKQLATITLQQTGKDIANIKYGGTAGGAAAGLFAYLDAKLVNGIDYYLQLTEFDKSLEEADLVITGEGSIDEQTLQGKGPFGVAFKAKQKALPVVALAGKVPLKKDLNLQEYFDVLLAIGNQPAELETAMKTVTDNLVRTAWELGNLLAVK